MAHSDLAYVGRQIQGERERQEDHFAFVDGPDFAGTGDELAMLVMADGMGGHVGGATASELVVSSVIDTYQEFDGLVTDRLRESLTAANDAIAQEVDVRPELKGMGSTLIAVVVTPEGLEWVSVGDSPMWLYREGRLRRLNADHSMSPVFAQLVKIGKMTPEDAAADRGRHSLRSAIIGEDISLIDVSSQPIELLPYDILVLASDGVETLDVGDLEIELSKVDEVGLQAVADGILDRVEAARKAGQDNASLMLFSNDSGHRDSRADVQEERTIRMSESSRRRSRPLATIAVALAVVVLLVGILEGVGFIDVVRLLDQIEDVHSPQLNHGVSK